MNTCNTYFYYKSQYMAIAIHDNTPLKRTITTILIQAVFVLWYSFFLYYDHMLSLRRRIIKILPNTYSVLGLRIYSYEGAVYIFSSGGGDSHLAESVSRQRMKGAAQRQSGRCCITLTYCVRYTRKESISWENLDILIPSGLRPGSYL